MKPQKQSQDLTDIEFMQCPSLWPRWPLLPLKRVRKIRGGYDTECGLLFAHRDHKLQVFRANLFNEQGIRQAIENNESYQYSSYDEIVNDGWIVD